MKSIEHGIFQGPIYPNVGDCEECLVPHSKMSTGLGSDISILTLITNPNILNILTNTLDFCPNDASRQ